MQGFKDIPTSQHCLFACLFKVGLKSTYMFNVFQCQAFGLLFVGLDIYFPLKDVSQVLIRRSVSRQFSLLIYKNHFSSVNLYCFCFQSHECTIFLHSYMIFLLISLLIVFLGHHPHLLVECHTRVGKGVCSSYWYLSSSMLLCTLVSWQWTHKAYESKDQCCNLAPTDLCGKNCFT